VQLAVIVLAAGEGTPLDCRVTADRARALHRLCFDG
jgi:bifunctional N-acetylglucosamine-1-phosphate-uridyltransferase/glucosamine-1-phosphate-acetyltransferase GlmU-like protein